MGNISKFQLPTGGLYNLKDSQSIHVDDFKVDGSWSRGVLLFSSEKENGITALKIGQSGEVLSISNGLPVWMSASSAAGVQNGQLKLKIGNEYYTFFSANSSDNRTLDFQPGDSDGTIKVLIKNDNGETLKSVEVEVNFQDDSAAKVTAQSLKDYADSTAQNKVNNAIAALGHLLNYKGIKSWDDIKALTSANIGDVYITPDGTEYVCKEAISGSANEAAWEKLGPVININDLISTTVYYDRANDNTNTTEITPKGSINVGSTNSNLYTPTGSVTYKKASATKNDTGRFISGDIVAPSMTGGAASSWSFSIGEDETLVISGGNGSLPTFNPGSIPLSNPKEVKIVTDIQQNDDAVQLSGNQTSFSFVGTKESHKHGIGHTQTQTQIQVQS